MLYEQGLLDALEDLQSQEWEGEVWRFVLGDKDPLQPNTRGARWNPPDTAALYASLQKLTVLAELDHIRSLQVPEPRREQFVLHKIRTRVTRLVDLTDPFLLKSLGVGETQLSSDDQSACRQVGGASAWLGYDGILVPSARADGANLVVFVNVQHPDLPLEPIVSEPAREISN